VVLFASDDVKLALNTATMITAWSLSEIIRYSFYACKELGGVPYVVEWVRYSGFIVLYPIGVASELTMIYRGLPHMQGNGAAPPPLSSALAPRKCRLDTHTTCHTVVGYFFDVSLTLTHVPCTCLLRRHVRSAHAERHQLLLRVLLRAVAGHSGVHPRLPQGE